MKKRKVVQILFSLVNMGVHEVRNLNCLLKSTGLLILAMT